MSAFDHLTLEGKISAIYGQILDDETKTRDILARIAALEQAVSDVMFVVSQIRNKVLATEAEYTPPPDPTPITGA